LPIHVPGAEVGVESTNGTSLTSGTATELNLKVSRQLRGSVQISLIRALFSVLVYMWPQVKVGVYSNLWELGSITTENVGSIDTKISYWV
jgi:hypothetical protein